MTPFNKISDAEKVMMADWITCYATESMKQPIASMENLLSYWNDAKTSGDLYTLLGDKLILTKEVNYKRHSEDYWREIRDELFNTAFYRNLRSYVRDKMWEESKIPNANNWSTLWYALDNIGYWVDNHYGPKNDTLTKEEKKEWYEINLPIPGKEKPMVIRYGDKMMRFVGKLAVELKIEGFEEFRIKQSQIVNDRYTKGELCLSIHPMDYMTMSDNDCNWESCMNWRYHGDYRQGTVEMMNSPCVVVAYVKSHKDMENGWNNKKWRQLFIVRPDVIVPIKGYPYRNETLEDACMDWLRELAQKNLNWTYEDEKIYLKNDSQTVNYKDKTYGFDIYTNCMYNDIYDTHPSWINPEAESFVEHGSFDKFLTFTYSGVSECMICGDIHDFDYNNNANELACYDCSDTRYCAYCHGRIYSDDNCYEIDGEIVCDDCYWDTESCQVCGERHSDYNLKLIYIYKNWDRYDSGIDRWCERETIAICKDCFEDIWNSLSKYPLFKFAGYTSYKVEDTDDEFFKLFGYESKKDFLEIVGWDSDEEETE